MADPTLLVKRLELSFGGVRTLRGVDLAIEPGRITGIIGPNGAGKTSLFNCLTGLYQPNAGEIFFEGAALTLESPVHRARHGVARTFQRPALCEELSVAENVMAGRFARSRNGWLGAFLPLPGALAERRELKLRATAALAALGIAERRDEAVASLPPGLRRMVELARALATEPRLLLLDEPAAGLNSFETARLREVLQKARSPERTLLLVEHDMELVMTLCDVIYVMNFGEIIAYGTPAEIRSDPNVVRVYLGTDHD